MAVAVLTGGLDPSDGVREIDGISHLLAGGTENSDSCLDGIAVHDTGGAQHSVSQVSEPGTGLLVGLGLVGLATRIRRMCEPTSLRSDCNWV